VAREDKAAVGRATGVGVKLALRIVTELKDKPIGAGLSMPSHTGTSAPIAPISAAVATSGEAVAALMGLGVAEPLARRAVETASERLGVIEPALPILIKAALQELGR
jgi:Holliday junction DNA helicase RuvA